MKDELAQRLDEELDARISEAPPSPNVGRVVRAGMVRRRARRAVAASGFLAVAAVGVALPNLDLSSESSERQSVPAAAGVEEAGRMTVPRAAHAATLLENGKVLISGGFSGDTEIYYDSAEIFDPVTRMFTPTTLMTTPRTGHGSVLLDDGKVLIVGGWGNGFLDSAELYDARTGLFTATGSMKTTRDAFTATRLQDGRVLVVGGFRGSYDRFNRSAEIYDPSTGEFTSTGGLRRPRASHTATLLSDGRVVISGGLGPGGVLRSIEIFNPSTGRFTAGGRMVTGRHKHGSTLLDDGTILMMGGADIDDFEGRLRSAEVYTPTTGKSRSVGNMNSVRFKVPSPVNLPGHRSVLVVGGANTAELYLERSRRFADVGGTLDGAQSFPTATLLQDGSVLVTGGYDEDITATDGAWIFSVES